VIQHLFLDIEGHLLAVAQEEPVLEQAHGAREEGKSSHEKKNPRKERKLFAQDDVVDDEARDERHGEGHRGVQQDDARAQGRLLPVPPEKRFVTAQVLADAGISLPPCDPVLRHLPVKSAPEMLNPALHWIVHSLMNTFENGTGTASRPLSLLRATQPLKRCRSPSSMIQAHLSDRPPLPEGPAPGNG